MLKRLIFTNRAVIGKDAFGNAVEIEGQFYTWFGRHLIEAYVIAGALLAGTFALLR